MYSFWRRFFSAFSLGVSFLFFFPIGLFSHFPTFNGWRAVTARNFGQFKGLKIVQQSKMHLSRFNTMLGCVPYIQVFRGMIMQYIDIEPFADFIRQRNLLDERHLPFCAILASTA
jgi:hypothetical protein